MSNSINLKLDILRNQVRALEKHGVEASADFGILPLPDEHLNAPFPGGGLQLASLHEFTAHGLESELAAAVSGFAATVAAKILHYRGGFLLWAASRADCYAPGLLRFNLDPERIVWVDCKNDAEILAVMEEALHSRALAAVMGEAGALSFKNAQRLAAAAKQSNTAALLVRRHFSKISRRNEGPSGAASTRWRVSTMASDFRQQDFEPGVSPPLWRLDLEYCRNGRTSAWIVEALDGSSNYAPGHVRVVAELSNEAGAAQKAIACKAERTARAC